MKNKKILVVIATACMTLILLAGDTLGWYYNSNKVNLNKIDGAVTYLTKYFESGDGTGPDHAEYDQEGNIVSESGCAYEIKTAEQFYNLAWLQYMGYFNQPGEGTNAIPTTYFYLSADIDMTGYVLPPIGTSYNPFLGNFDGCGFSVSGLTVTNKVSGSGTPIKDLPYTLVIDGVNEVEGVEIIGLFGVVGTLDASTTGNESDANVGSYTYSSITNEVKNLYINGLTVETQTDHSLIGIAAGYVNGTVENVGIINSNIRIDGTVQNLSYTENMSDYSLVGYCTEAYKDTVDVALVEFSTPTVKKETIQAVDTGNAWGGSIAMESLYNRLSGLYDKAAPIEYSTKKTVVIDIDGNETVTENVTTARNNNIISYDDSDKNSGTNAGRVTFSKRSTGDKSFILLYGEKEIEYSKTVTTTKTELVSYEGTYISNGYYYLTATTRGITNGVTVSQNPSLWNITQEGYIITYIDNTPYYLNRNDSTLAISEDPNTIWTTENGLIYCVSTEANYYLACSDTGEWSLSRQTKYYYLTDGTNYLVYNGTLGNTQTKADATHWNFTSSGSGYRISCTDGNTTYYLGYNNNNGLTTMDSANNASTWYIDDTGIYCQSNNSTKYYLLCENGSWSAEPEQYTISYGDNYLSVNDGAIATTGQADASTWTYSNNYLSTVSGNTTYYLNLKSKWSSASLTISNQGSTSWTVDVDSGYCYSTYLWYKYYICYSGGNWSPATSNTKAVLTKVGKTLAYQLEGELDVATFIVSMEEGEEGSFEQTTTTEINETSSYLTPDSFVPLAADPDNYGVKRNNTGYIISGAQYTDPSNTTTLLNSGDIRVSSDFFNYSHLNFSNNTNDTKYSASGGKTLEIVTITAKSGGEYVRIQDTYNKNNTSVNSTLSAAYPEKINYNDLGLKKYEASRDTLHKNLNDSTTGYLYGLHFMDAKISADNVVTIPHAVINDTDYYDFQMPRDCIDFTLKESGFINFFAGSYFTNNNTFFSLHQIFRKENGDIDFIRQISKIYDLGDGSYAYLYADSADDICSDGKPHDESELIFDLQWIMEPKLGGCVGTQSNGYKGALYYFEVPANAGEYALGSVDGGIGAYLIYLDISANAQDVERTETTEVTTTTTTEYTYPKGVDFLATNSGLTGLTNSAAIALPVGSGGSVNYQRSTEESSDVITVTARNGSYATYIRDGTVVRDSDGNAIPAKGSLLSTVVEKKVTVTDYNTMTKVTTNTVTIITDTTVNGTTTRTVTIIDENGDKTPGTSNEKITRGNTILKYHYMVPDGAIITNDSSLTTTGTTAGGDLTGKYVITVTSTADINVYVDSIELSYKNSHINGTTAVAGAVIPVKASTG